MPIVPEVAIRPGWYKNRIVLANRRNISVQHCLPLTGDNKQGLINVFLDLLPDLLPWGMLMTTNWLPGPVHITLRRKSFFLPLFVTLPWKGLTFFFEHSSLVLIMYLLRVGRYPHYPPVSSAAIQR